MAANAGLSLVMMMISLIIYLFGLLFKILCWTVTAFFWIIKTVIIFFMKIFQRNKSYEE